MPEVHQPPSHDNERARAHARREALGLTRPAGQQDVQWALALSGGGIRSATFCLGLLQSLAKSPSPPESSSPSSEALPEPSVAAAPMPHPLLAQFDYVSTVSGGGYIGGFFNSLFVKGRLSGQPDETHLRAATRAYEALREDPPGRIRSHTVYQPERPGAAALAWLRDNGRYMAPTGGGDLMYGMAIALRNWVATQYVTGLVIAMALVLLLVARFALAQWVPTWNQWEQQARHAADGTRHLIWWSPSWLLPGLVALLGTLPLGMAYWFSHPTEATAPRDYLASKPHLCTPASILGLMAGVLLGGLGFLLPSLVDQHAHLRLSLLGAGLIVVLAVLWFMLSARQPGDRSITQQRVALTRWLSASLMALLGTAMLATVETMAQTALLWLHVQQSVVTAGVLGGVVWLLRQAAQSLGDKTTSRLSGIVPVNLMVGALGVLLWFALACGLDALLLATVWPEEPYLAFPASALARNPDSPFIGPLLGMTLSAAGVLALLNVIVGRFPGFLNLSTFQNLYSARLIRAYLGASNFRRFDPNTPARHRDVAEPIAGDSLPLDAAYANPCGPTHFITVCVNQTISPGEQLLQRDRKGKPLILAPKGFYVDQSAYALAPTKTDKTELAYPLSYGEWIGVSGAAFSTGLGRASSLGFSLALGFANVRLGRWWPGIPRQDGQRDGPIRRWFTPQVYLIDELRSRFFGDHRQYQYLSDGGHFDNTGVYELLNPERDRHVRLIMLADCGCDPDYEFDDLANLIRLARIDHGLDIMPNPVAPEHPLLKQYFARPLDFRRSADGSLPAARPCAVLLDVRTSSRHARPGLPAGSLVARIVLLKPTLPPGLPGDIDQYHLTHASFPHEPTVDLFFDEAQWESYRQLGLALGQRVLPQGRDSPYDQAFWQVCLDGLPGTS